MSTIYAWDEPAVLTANTLSSADLTYIYDASAALTKTATFYDIQQVVQTQAVATVSSNDGTVTGGGTVSGIALMGTSTAAVLQVAQRAGMTRTFTSGTSTVAYTVTASASSFGFGTVWTQLGGGTVSFYATSTSRWAIAPAVAHGSTLLA